MNATLSPIQQRNLESAWGQPVVDRVGLILELFRQRARTREAILQVRLASLQYAASRLIRVQGMPSGLSYLAFFLHPLQYCVGDFLVLAPRAITQMCADDF